MDPRGVVEELALSPALAGCMGYLLGRAYARARQCAAAAIPEPHRARHLAVLAMLRGCGPLSQRELGVLARINRTLMVKLVDELEEHGLVVRERNPSDRRSYVLAPTAHGLATLRTLMPALALGDAQLTAPLSRIEQERLNELLRRLLPAGADQAMDLLGRFSGYLLVRAHGQFRQRTEDALAPLGLVLRQFAALAALRAEQPCSQQRIATILGVTPPAVLPVIDEMDLAGLVGRTRNQADRRAYRLTLTAAGRDKLRAAQRALAEVQSAVAGCLGADGDEELCLLLAKLLQPAHPQPDGIA
ncbi:MAG TPA: MarR family transcriptional regulator [Mycobacteriales bacterium]|nr:MarR family transcriptional regulator [Mycobacteriales bacterium]